MTAQSARRLRRGAAISTILLFVIVGAGLVFRSLPHELPAPSGSFSVGRTEFLLDQHGNRISPSAPESSDSLVLVLWYPTVAGAPGLPSRYVPPRQLAAIEKHAGIGRFLYQDLRRVRAQSIEDAPISLRRASYPVLLLLPCTRLVPFIVTSLAEQMASIGFVVAAVSQADADRYLPVPPLSGAAEQEQHARELTAVDSAVTALQSIDQSGSGQFSARLDLSRLALVGLGQAGPAAAEAADAVGSATGRFAKRAGLPALVPVVQIGGPAAGGRAAMQPQLLIDASATGAEPRDAAAAGGRGVTVRVPGAKPLDFTDVGFIFAPLLHLRGQAGGVAPERTRRIAAELIETFVQGAWSAVPPVRTADLFQNAAAAAGVAVREKAISFGLTVR